MLSTNEQRLTRHSISVWSCGQVMSLIKDIPTCQKLVDDIVQEAITTIQNRLCKMIVPGARM